MVAVCNRAADHYRVNSGILLLAGVLDMSRLLFAAARGARIQAEWKGVWSGVAGIHFVPEFNYRIHPDDEHLQYGPISTALREMAENHNHNSSWEHFLANIAAQELTEYFDSRRGEPDYPLFYLFLAEALADEGM